LEVLENEAGEIHADALESKLTAAGPDPVPALFDTGGARQSFFELGQPGLKIDDAPETALPEQPAGRREFGVTQVLNARPGGRAKRNHDQCTELIAKRTGN